MILFLRIKNLVGNTCAMQIVIKKSAKGETCVKNINGPKNRLHFLYAIHNFFFLS